ncbi:MAG: IscS subfamily cysteine desulfurase [Dehalococcoidia bacterium]|nr:IscS subfamily cysteine desulfurase [Dehalococcoidia bacterium]
MRRVYMDNTASTPLLPEVLDAMLPFLKDTYGNPQSIHDWGDPARDAIEDARNKVASLIGGRPEEIIFTSSGTEANNMAIKGLAQAQQSKGRHVVISAIEHFSVLHSARTLEKQGFEVTLIPVDRHALIDPADVARVLRKDTVLVSIMHANAEVGTIQPIADIAKAVKEAGAVFHTDAVATVGTIPVDVNILGVDALSLAANPFYGPKGAAALWVRRGVRILPLMDGGVQENGRRPGTENVPAIVGMGMAAYVAESQMGPRIRQIVNLRDRLISGLLSSIDHMSLSGHPTRRLPGTASFLFEFIEGESMLMLMNQRGIAASSGSACTSRALKASHVLIAMGIPPQQAHGSLLFSLGIHNNEEDVDYVVASLPPIVHTLREMSPLYDKFMRGQRGGTEHANLQREGDGPLHESPECRGDPES